MVNGNELTDGPIWFTNFKDLPDMLASVVRTWTLDEMPEEVYKNEEKFTGMYSEDKQKQEILEQYVDGLFRSRKEELEKEDGGHVGGDEVLALAEAEDQRALLLDGNHRFGVVLAENAQGVAAL